MKVNASCAPNKNFRVEKIPNKPGFALARFFENVVGNEKKIDDKTIKEYNYDEYHLILPYYDNIEKDIPANIENLMTQAKYEEEEKNTIPAKMEILKTDIQNNISSCYLTIHEGKFHQVKRMMKKLGKTVTYLKRVSMGSLILDSKLKKGNYRKLTEQEIIELKNN